MQTLAQKAVSVLRADLKELVKLISDYELEKYTSLIEILNFENIINYNIKNKKDAEIYAGIEQIDLLIESINVIDYEISLLRDKLCSITGIEYSSYDKFISGRDESEFKKLYNLKKSISSTLKNISEIKQYNINEMVCRSSVLGRQIRELFSIRNLDFKYNTKALQSF